MRTEPSFQSVLVIADPGTTEAIGKRLSESLSTDSDNTEGRHVSTRSHAYPIEEHTDFADVVGTIDPDSASEDIVIYLTDLARRSGTTPLIAEIHRSKGLGVISIPAMGAAFVERRTRDLARMVVAEVSIESDEPATNERIHRVQDDDVVHYLAPSRLSRLRLLAGMVYANRPWRVVAGMSKVMMAAFATGAVSLAYGTMWQLSDMMGPWRLTVATILSIAALIAWLIIEHKLWERPSSPEERERALLYNMSTVVTLTIGVIVFYVVVFFLLLLTAWWTIPPDMVTDQVGHPMDFWTLVVMAWLVASVATLGGALGSGMEDDDAVRAATYGARQRRRFERDDDGNRRSGKSKSR
ncbi:hypothetical protein [Gordonia sp. NPDC127522]|uniref:hypothetical protein n=1 Tax=Gordonia sp. NPDC127522 TaxID=3345390 RepID=UPI00363B60E2